jgi:hypothetical protein
MARDPYCRNCGYSLKGLTESSRCPECGKPIVEVLERGPLAATGRRYKSSIVIFGLPLIHIARGPYDDEKQGHARGIIAIGDVATGWLAIGGFARGIIAFGGVAVGVIAFGGLSIGLLLALGGGAVGGIAVGGGAVGGLAMGGGVAGFVAQGGGAVGYYAEGGAAWGRYVLTWNRTDAEARRLFDTLASLIGTSPTAGWRGLLVVIAWCLVATFFLGLACATIVALAYLLQRRRSPPTEVR